MNFTPSDYEGLFHQAKDTAADYLKSANHLVDELHGEGYAKDNSTLVGQVVHAMATDFQSMALSRTMTVFVERLAYALNVN